MIDLHIDKAYYADKKPVLKDFSLLVNEGETVTLTGPSGSGKSTILKIIAGLHAGFDGTVATATDSKIALIPQNKHLLPWKTVLQNCMLLWQTQGKPDHDAARTLLNALGLNGLEEQYPLQLSGGQYQRVMLGQALFYEPDLLLMDEPFSALDNDTKREIIGLFLRLREKISFTTLFVTHNMEEAQAMGGRIVRLHS